MPYIRCEGADLYYEEVGEGHPIVFLHGVMHSMRFFDQQLHGLSDDYRRIAFDFRGHGRSEKTELGHTVAQYARDLHAFLQRRELDQVVLVGWSMGAFVSWDYVDQFGTERILGLVDVDIEASRFQWDDYQYGLVDLEGLIELLALVQRDHTSVSNRFAEQGFANPTADLLRLQFDETSRTPAPIKSAILFDALTRDYRAILPTIDIPMLVCAGGRETRGSVEAVSYVAELVPDARFEVFEQSGHAPHVDEPNHFNRVLTRFVDSLKS